MKTLQGIHVTDEVNRYNEKFTFEAMFDAYEKYWQEYFPFNANHDMTMPIGCSRLTGIYLSPGKAYSTNIVYIGETDKEEAEVVKLGLNSLHSREMTENESKITELKSKLGSNLKDKGIIYFTNGCFIYEKDLVKRVFPELCNNIDENGLVDLNLLTPVLPGIYKVGERSEFVIYAHRYFRRGFSHLNALNTDFLQRFDKLRGADIKIKIAIDTDCVGLSSASQIAKEYEYWWGPKFNDNLTDIPIGLTVHNNENYNEIMSPIKKTEFRWYEQGGKHTFECEEICGRLNLKCDENKFYGCRFVHSMVDYDKQQPVHLDGAIRAYTQDKMINRESTTLDKTGRDTVYTKLWRIDNAIPIDVWKELITHYYRDNMLVGEYFNGRDKIIDEIKETRKSKESKVLKLSNFVPCYLSASSGLRFKISYHNLSTQKEDVDIQVIPTTYITSNKGQFLTIESFAITFNKLLKRRGLTLDIPKVEYTNYQDKIYNLPLYKCKTPLIANEVMSVFQNLIYILVAKELDLVISFSLEVPYASRSVLYSFIGHIKCFNKYFNSQGFKPIPITEEAVAEWCSNFYKGISVLFGNDDDVDPFHIMRMNDVLVADRKYIESKYIEKIEQYDRGIQLFFKLNNEECDLFAKNKITSGTAFIEKETECTKCKMDYSKCKCILYTDEGVCKIIKKADIIGYFWKLE